MQHARADISRSSNCVLGGLAYVVTRRRKQSHRSTKNTSVPIRKTRTPVLGFLGEQFDFLTEDFGFLTEDFDFLTEDLDFPTEDFCFLGEFLISQTAIAGLIGRHFKL